jgi:hypothetical protein
MHVTHMARSDHLKLLLFDQQQQEPVMQVSILQKAGEQDGGTSH